MKATQKAALALALTIVSTGASADTTNFEGLSIFGAASAVTNAVKTQAGTDVIDGLGKSGFSTSVGADYGLKISETAVVLLGGTYNLGSVKMFDVNLIDPSVDEILSAETKTKTQWSLYAAPGITFGKDVLLYGKLAYVSAKLSMDGAKTHPGMGYGAGARFALTNQLFLNVEFMRNEIGKKTYTEGGDTSDLSWSSTAGTVALGYRF